MKMMKSVFVGRAVVVILFLFFISGTGFQLQAKAAGGACKKITKAIKKYNQFKAKSEYWEEVANCNNISNPKTKKACLKKAKRHLKDGIEESSDIFDAQLDVCGDLGKGVYTPSIDPSVFTTTIDNKYFPLVPGTTYVYNGETDTGTEVDKVSVLTNTIMLMGVNCRVVRDTVYVDGKIVEDTFDYYAQDKDGNVWYFGEESKTYNKKGVLVDLEGSWLAGVNGAQPGIIMEGNPQKGDIYRQEYSAGNAEDIAKVVSLNETVTVSGKTYTNCLKTKEYSPLEPDVVANKYYAPNVGTVHEQAIKGEKEIVDLVEIKTQ
ncbi:MAG: hypothetical protein D6734_05260 [Candidatus Schekmanbacteria bacterium]|nr:MAG: hypothetical protein D6734_05260 [Candidatus Schekmanbacteria bacterium]